VAEEQTQNEQPKRVMAIMSHPDDIEFGAAGTVARWAAEGQHITFVLGTSGDKGSDDPNFNSETLMATREEEQRKAADILGVQEVIFLRYKDAELVADLELRRAITRVIRQHKPDAVICQDPVSRYQSGYINHPDHIAMGEAVLAAIYPSARDRLTFPELLAEGLEPHKVTEVYLSADDERCDFFVDIGEYLDKKFASLKAHDSQLGSWEFEELMRRWSRDSAALARAKNYPGSWEMEYAEAFKRIQMGF
jgi:LmbE family N-acetylglucosaminyl deacetylase